jgi:hypothetical protein
VTLNLTDQARLYLEQLEQIAEQENRTLEALLETIINQYSQKIEGTPGYIVAEAMAQVQLKGGVDTSSRTREILEKEYGDYILSRLNRDAE